MTDSHHFISSFRAILFDRLLADFGPHALRLRQALGRYLPELGKLVPDTEHAVTQPQTGALAVPVPMRLSDNGMTDGTFSVWVFPGELRTGMLLPAGIDALWAAKQQPASLIEAFKHAWAGGAGNLPTDPECYVQRQAYAGSQSRLYDWRFTDASVGMDAWLRAAQSEDAADVLLDALENRIRHIWVAVAVILVRAGIVNQGLSAAEPNEWMLEVAGPEQPEAVQTGLLRLDKASEVKFASQQGLNNWVYVATSRANLAGLAASLGERYRVNAKPMPRGNAV